MSAYRTASMTTIGSVALVGAGPGHPGLMTGRARQVLAGADAVVYDRLLSPRILGFAPPTADFVYVGKQPGHHAMKQEHINERLVELALQGKNVVRLKGGDPFVFGRGGEEALACRQAGIPFEVVPGVTSPVAVSAFAGIPVTHRGIATSFSVITGHQCADGREEDVDWRSLALSTGTLVILMGIRQLEDIVHRLLVHGRNPDTPAALIRWGTRAAQQTLTGTLDRICQRAKEADFGSPAIAIVGEVVSLRDTLAWFEKRPLMGKRVFVAADTQTQGRAMAEAAESLGAEVLDISVEQGSFVDERAVLRLLKQPADPVSRVGRLDSPESGLLFCKVQAVHHFFHAVRSLDLDWRTLAQYRFGALHPDVEHALRQHGIHADFVTPLRFGHQAADSDADIVRIDGMTEAECFQICHEALDTAQFYAMFNACDAPFDVCWATSREALQFAKSVQARCNPRLPVPSITAWTDAAETGAYERTARVVDDLAAVLARQSSLGSSHQDPVRCGNPRASLVEVAR
ncbi:uroporphyrinogen-III C-methyltransferase [Alicyclobacillus tolerans]|uniref:uroporphyrinogen-III C-methyltransferase n=1 Tax=Alicyclobacillus tolerans TaxID=90970 RepID=UPI001F014F42|nr:uroporphyrinogen-III C-methyltransferase [Alicyclobacillus tolerans]MCF8565526.1 uroporphyrinogen-III C-methyltransferase [Alicyclobacillus tolerans]